MNYENDTIAALATPAGIGAISVIRISGPHCFDIVNSIFQGKKDISEWKSHTIHYGKITTLKNEELDDVLISIFKKPHSYTGEDTVEISTHGNPLISQKVLETLIQKNVRLAEPGEFTKRAFLNERMDLAQAEAVADIINSRTIASLKGARNQLDGHLSAKVHELRQMLLKTSSLVELELDFAEEDLEFVSHETLVEEIQLIIKEIEKLLETYSFGKVVRDGINVALVGMPNVGKSSLLNYIVKEHRAIVSSIPGTTRDIIREDVTIDGFLYRLFDTAGLRSSSDEIEIEGIERSRRTIQFADVVLLLDDVKQGICENLLQEIQTLTDKDKIVSVMNKIDLVDDNPKGADVYISIKTGEGMNHLFDALKEKTIGQHVYTEKTAIVSNLRHYDNLKKAADFLCKAIDSANNGLTGEFISVDLRNAENVLGEIIGEVTSEDILNNIFKNFCIGK